MLGVPNAVTTFYKAVYKCVYNNNDLNMHGYQICIPILRV